MISQTESGLVLPSYILVCFFGWPLCISSGRPEQWIEQILGKRVKTDARKEPQVGLQLGLPLFRPHNLTATPNQRPDFCVLRSLLTTLCQNLPPTTGAVAVRRTLATVKRVVFLEVSPWCFIMNMQTPLLTVAAAWCFQLHSQKRD